jgi:hypothetical protein
MRNLRRKNSLYDFRSEHVVMFYVALRLGRDPAINTHVPGHTKYEYLKDKLFQN